MNEQLNPASQSAAATGADSAPEQGVGRRFFLRASLAAGAVLVVGCEPEVAVPPNVPATPTAPAPSQTATAAAAGPAQPFAPNAWVRIAPDSTVTIVVDRSEMGQGVETSVPMIIADELDADWAKIKIEFAPVGADYKNPAIGMQATGGSTTIRGSFMAYRKVGAVTREMLVAAAAATWGVEASTCRTEKGEVVHPPTGKRAAYGTLTDKAAAIPVPKDPKLKSPSEFRFIGTRVQRLDGMPKATGKAEFGMDVRRPGMLVACVARCPVIGGKVAKFDPAPAAAIKGVKKVLQISNGVAVVAEHFWAAKKGVEALNVSWDNGPNATVSSDAMTKAAAELAKKPGVVAKTKGDVEKALKASAKHLDAVYEVPYQAHAAMEPLNCTVEAREGGADVWVGTQFQEPLQKVAAGILGLSPGAIAVHTTYLGGGFGRRAEMDFCIDALEVAKQMRGVPIKLMWTREDDMRHDLYRPAAYNVLRGGIDKEGKLSAWSHRAVSSSIMSRVFPAFVKNGLDNSAVEGANELPYELPNMQMDWHDHKTGIPVGFWRSVGSSINAFVTECFFDELCALAKKDPFEMRKSLMGEAPRLRGALELAAAKAGWGKPMEKGKGRGIACASSFGSHVAQVAEVTVSDDGKVKVDRVVCAIDCGIVVNPDTVEAQMQGGIVYGLTAALKSGITLTDGKVDQGNFQNFRLLRMDEMPVVEVYIVPSTENPGGAGEPGTPPIAPAVANAIFAATGKRIRKLPIKQADLKKK